MTKIGPSALPETTCIRINTSVALRRRSRLVAALLGILLGGFGAHRFYLGYRRTAVLQITVTICTLGVGAVWGAVEGWLILLGRFARDAQGACLTQRTEVQLLAASLGSLTVHAGTALGAVWLSHHYGPLLMPPPSGVDSAAVALSMPAASAEPIPEEIEVSVEPLPEIEREPLQELEATPVTAAQRAEPAEPTRAEPVQAESMQPELSAGRTETEPLAGPGPTQRTAAQSQPAPAMRGESPIASPPPLPKAQQAATVSPPAKTPAQVKPTTAESLRASEASAASVASQENRGFDTDALPSKVEFPRPVYPPELRRRGITGLVKLRVRVGVDGRVRAASVYRTSGHAAFDRAALDVIRRWRFEPARQAGVAVEMEIAVPIRFTIEAQTRD